MSATAKEANASTLAEIQAAIQSLPASEGWKLLRWLGDYLNDEWDKDIFGAEQAHIIALTRARLQENAKDWQAETGQRSRGEIALEPVFVAELAALLEVIRLTHAG